MGLIFDVLSAINDPKKVASVESLGGIYDGIQQLAGNHGLNSAATQSIVSSVGDQLRTSLQKQATGGNAVDIAGLIGKFATGSSTGASLQSLIPDSAQQLLLKGMTDKLGLSSTGALGLVGSLAPLLLKFLNLGSSSQGVGSNPILTTFLDSNHDGNVDLGDALKFAGRFLTR
ncbi:MAG: DUF937 domain-containing protein [Cyanobacteriota bacterium ELA615]|jgi:hypothetical protein